MTKRVAEERSSAERRYTYQVTFLRELQLPSPTLIPIEFIGRSTWWRSDIPMGTLLKIAA